MKHASEEAPRPRRSVWPFLIVGLLLTHVSVMILAVKLASGDSGHAVVPDYYNRAVHWDDLRAEKAQSAALGWQLAVTPAVLVDRDGLRRVRFEMTDADGAPVALDSLHVSTYHLAIAEPFEADATPLEVAGVFSTRLPMKRAGSWQLEVRATSGEQHFLDDRVIRIAAPVL